MTQKIYALFLTMFLSSTVLASSAVVKKNRAPLRKKPSKKSKVLRYLKEGKTIRLVSPRMNLSLASAVTYLVAGLSNNFRFIEQRSSDSLEHAKQMF